MAGDLSPAVKAQVEKALKEGDFGEEQADGSFLRTFDPITPKVDADRGEVETVSPKTTARPKTPAEIEQLPRKLAYQLMAHYIKNINDRTFLNPIIDGIPQCVAHPFKSGSQPGCYQGCTSGILPRSKDQTVGDVLAWVQGLIAYNFKAWQKKNPGLRGYVRAIM